MVSMLENKALECIRPCDDLLIINIDRTRYNVHRICSTNFVLNGI